MKKELTVIITANLIPSHPGITQIKNVIDSLDFLGLPDDMHIILAHDNIHPEVAEVLTKAQARYDKYFRDIQQYIDNSCKYKRVDVVMCSEWGHLTRNVLNAISNVDTPYILLLQHDLPFIRKLSLADAFDIVKNNADVKHLRFNHRKNLPTGWDGTDSRYDPLKCVEAFKEVSTAHGPICKTLCWSDRNHIASTQHYIDVIFPACDVDSTTSFMEQKLNRKNKLTPEKYGTYIYGAYGENAYIESTDGAVTYIPDFIFDEQYCLKKYPELASLAVKPNSLKNIYVDRYGHTPCLSEDFNWIEYSQLIGRKFKSPNSAYRYFKNNSTNK